MICLNKMAVSDFSNMKEEGYTYITMESKHISLWYHLLYVRIYACMCAQSCFILDFSVIKKYMYTLV